MDLQATINAGLQPLNDRLDRLAEQQEQQARINERVFFTGMKPMEIALITGKASGSALLIGGDTGQALATPESGYIWSLRKFIVEGLTAAAANPDVVNILWGGRIQWQLNGNSFGVTFGRGEQVIWPGQTITIQSVGTFASTATIIGHGVVDNVPAELQGRFV